MTDDFTGAAGPDEPNDASLDRIIRELRPLPPIDSAAKARVLVAVAADRTHAQEEAARRRASLRIAAMVAIAAVLVAVVFVSRVGIGEGRAGAAVATHPVGTTNRIAQRDGASGAALAANSVSDADAALVPVQLVVRAPTAKRMAVVGDFTGWDVGRVAMTRDAASGLWSATVSVRPGRHVYAFVADDSVWMRDPRAPQAPDADFGRPGSLMLVTRP